MFEYALIFYNNHIILFYFFLIIAVIFEGPITILAFSIISINLGISFFEVLIFSFIGEFCGDLLHYLLGRFFKVNILKDKNYSLLEKIEKKLKKHSLFEQLIVIKYTPPITSIGLLYMGIKKENIVKFIKNISIFAIINGMLLITIGYNFGYLFKDKTSLHYLIILLFLTFVIFYLIVKIISSFFVKKILKNKTKS